MIDDEEDDHEDGDGWGWWWMRIRMEEEEDNYYLSGHSSDWLLFNLHCSRDLRDGQKTRRKEEDRNWQRWRCVKQRRRECSVVEGRCGWPSGEFIALLCARFCEKFVCLPSLWSSIWLPPCGTEGVVSLHETRSNLNDKWFLWPRLNEREREIQRRSENERERGEILVQRSQKSAKQHRQKEG